jgi:prevent-host-death family protein
MVSVGIRQLKNHFSKYARRVELGERIAVTKRKRVIAELVPPATTVEGDGGSPDKEVADDCGVDSLIKRLIVALDRCSELLERQERTAWRSDGWDAFGRHIGASR